MWAYLQRPGTKMVKSGASRFKEQKENAQSTDAEYYGQANKGSEARGTLQTKKFLSFCAKPCILNSVQVRTPWCVKLFPTEILTISSQPETARDL